MKMHLKCNNKNDNGIIILYKGTRTAKETKKEGGKGTAVSGAHFMPMPESMLHYLQLVNFYSSPRRW